MASLIEQVKKLAGGFAIGGTGSLNVFGFHVGE